MAPKKTGDKDPSEEVAEPQAASRSHHEGGGAWPPELLAKVGTTSGRALRDIPEYTSHEQQPE